MTRVYRTPQAFRQALEERLRLEASQGVHPLQRLRQLLVFERFWARLAQLENLQAVLKGGVALELRSRQARATKDIDLRVMGSPDRFLDQLEQALKADAGDFMVFHCQPDPHHPVLQAEGLQYGGRRYRAHAEIAGKLFGSAFGVDVAFAEPMVGEPEILTGHPWLSFIGIPAVEVSVYPVVVHLAEKLHAYTLPRSNPNSRIKDLPDLALLAGLGPLSATSLHRAFQATFSARGTHPLPTAFPDPPLQWVQGYATLAHRYDLPWHDLAEVTQAVRSFLEPVLGGDLTSQWEPARWTWG